MKAISHRQLATLLIMSLMVSGTVGCGPSKKKNRTRINGQEIVSKAEADAAAAAAATATEQTPEEKAAEEARLAEQEKLATDLAAVETAEKSVLGEAAVQVSAKDLPVGLYTLTEIATAFKYDRLEADDLAAEKLSVLSQGKIEIVKEADKAKDVKIVDSKETLAGIMSDDTDSERKIDIAVGFNVIEGTEKFSRKDDRSLNAVLKTRFDGQKIASEIKLGGDDTLAASLMGLLNSKDVQDDNGAEVLMSKDDTKTIALRLYKLSEEKFVAYLTVDEATGNATKIRNVYLTYSLTAPKAQAEEPAKADGETATGDQVSTQ